MKRTCLLRLGWLCLTAGLGFSLTGCVTNEAGRSQLILVSSSQESEMGLSSFNQLKKEVPISKDPAANDMLQRVGRRIASVVTLPNAQWEFVVFESKEANAFCLPGGKIGVYTGILPITKDEAGLATVIGHEVAHATLHHGAERVSNEMVRQGLGQLIGAGLSGSDPRIQAITAAAYGVGSQVGYSLPHSRSQESEADQRGLLYMARAGYDPEAAVAFWERFAAYVKQSGGGGTPAFLRTHPLDETRIANLKKWLPQARAEFRPAAK